MFKAAQTLEVRHVRLTAPEPLFPSLAKHKGATQLFVFPASGRNCQLIPITLTQTSIRAEQTTDLIHMNTHICGKGIPSVSLACSQLILPPQDQLFKL